MTEHTCSNKSVLAPPSAEVPLVHWMGVDVSKATFDAALWVPGTEGKHAWKRLPEKHFARTEEGAQACYAWALTMIGQAPGAPRPTVRVVMEATGKYSLELSAWFIAHVPSTAPAIINPRLSKAYSASLSIINRTDKTDARTLARYGAERTPAPYAPSAPEWAQLRDLTRYRQALVEMRQAEANRAEEPSCSAVVRETQNRRIKQLDRDIAKLDKKIKSLVQHHPEMNRDLQNLETIAGVGAVTATTILGELGDLRRFVSARQMTAFAGLAPTCHDSGTSVRKKSHVSKSGSAHVRRILYLAALAATRGHNDFADTYRRLTEQGKMKMVALVAVMRKILVVMRAILLSGEQYQSHRGKRSIACG